jgi:3-methyl-2-oxobutanoate hydroxymethyltransferase
MATSTTTPRRATISERVTIPDLAGRKPGSKAPIVMVTAYDAPQGRLADAAGVDAILVGDSVGMTTLGYDSTLPVTLDDIILHTRAVLRGQAAYGAGECPTQPPTEAVRVRGARHAALIADLPFGTCGVSAEDGVRAAIRLVAEGGAQAVKIEGAGPIVLETIRRLVDIGVPVIGHLGMTPQSIHRFGGFRAQGRTPDAADAMAEEARSLEAAGAIGIVLEAIPADVAARITASVGMVTIGIGAGPDCDGQVQVLHDIVGLTPGPPFRHTRRYAEIGDALRDAVASYATDVRERRFPAAENSF